VFIVILSAVGIKFARPPMTLVSVHQICFFTVSADMDVYSYIQRQIACAFGSARAMVLNILKLHV